MKVTLINTATKQIVDLNVEPTETLGQIAHRAGFPVDGHWFLEEIQPADEHDDHCDIHRPVHEHHKENPIFRCHPCRHVEVVVSYNGETKKHSFAPKARVKRVTRKFVSEFPVDKNLPWVLSQNETKEGILPENHVIGEYVVPGTCGTKLYLVDKDKIQG